MLSSVVVHGIMVLSIYIFLPFQFDGKYTEFKIIFFKNISHEVLNENFFLCFLKPIIISNIVYMYIILVECIINTIVEC